MRYYFLFFVLLLFLNSCQKEVKKNVDTSNIEVEFMINRFEQDFYDHGGENLEELKNKYPLLFPDNTPDSIPLAQHFSTVLKVLHFKLPKYLMS